MESESNNNIKNNNSGFNVINNKKIRNNISSNNISNQINYKIDDTNNNKTFNEIIIKEIPIILKICMVIKNLLIIFSVKI